MVEFHKTIYFPAHLSHKGRCPVLVLTTIQSGRKALVRIQLVARAWSYIRVDSIWLEKKEMEIKQLLIMPFTQRSTPPEISQ